MPEWDSPIVGQVIGLLLDSPETVRDGNGESSDTTNLSVLAGIQPVLLSKHLSGCRQPWINFQSSEKVHFGSFCLCSYCFSGGIACFRGSDSTISFSISLFLILILCNFMESFIWKTCGLGP